MQTPPNWVLDGLMLVAIVALASGARRAFFAGTYVWFAAVLLVLAATVVSVVTGHAAGGRTHGVILALSALVVVVIQTLVMMRARWRWLAEAAADPLVLAAPFEGRWKVVAGGPNPVSNHHLTASDQRFAYDLIRVGEPSLGSTILATIAGRVVSACDGQRDHQASRRAVEDPMPLGNHVAIDSGRGVVFLCHLQNGSVLVRPDDTVETGTPIGRCGNSGRTTGPHLHIHAQDLPRYAFNRARGIPIAFPTEQGLPRAPRAGSLIVGC